MSTLPEMPPHTGSSPRTHFSASLPDPFSITDITSSYSDAETVFPMETAMDLFEYSLLTGVIPGQHSLTLPTDEWHTSALRGDLESWDFLGGRIDSMLEPTPTQHLPCANSIERSGFLCSEAGCAKVFKRRSDLRRHINTIHSNERSERFFCRVADCMRSNTPASGGPGRGFPRKDKRNDHERRVHHLTGEDQEHVDRRVEREPRVQRQTSVTSESSAQGQLPLRSGGNLVINKDAETGETRIGKHHAKDIQGL